MQDRSPLLIATTLGVLLGLASLLAGTLAAWLDWVSPEPATWFATGGLVGFIGSFVGLCSDCSHAD